MENLNAEQIKADLEKWAKNFDGKVLNFVTLGNALALIKSQEQEIEALSRLVGEKIQEKVMLTAENKKIGIENFDLVCQLSRIKEDTVRKIADLLWQGENEKLNIGVGGKYYNKQEFTDQIAKELLEEK